MEYLTNVVEFFGLVCLVWLFVIGSEPIEFIKKISNLDQRSTSKHVAMIILRKLINCALCSGFWFGLVYYRSLEMAALTSVCSELFYRGWKWLPNKI